MRLSRSVSVALLVAGAVAITVPWWHSSSESPDRGEPDLLTDRVWFETLPEAPEQEIHLFMVLPDVPLGVFAQGSAYRSRLEVFETSPHGEHVDLRFPQDGRKADLKYRASACDDLPPFDVCLDLDSNPWGGPKRYHGFRDEPGAPDMVRQTRHRLTHAAVERP